MICFNSEVFFFNIFIYFQESLNEQKKKLTGKKQQAIRRLMRNGTENTQKGEWLEKQRQPQM